MEYIEEIDYKNHLIKIAQDDDPMAPDEWDDELVFLVSFDRYLQKCPEQSPVGNVEMLRELIAGPCEEDFEESDGCNTYYSDPDGAAIAFKEAFVEWQKERNQYAIFEVSVQTQGYTSMDFHGEPDVDTIKAAIFVKKSDGWGKGVDFSEIAKDYCKVWEQYLGGEVYGYMIKGPPETQQDLCEACGHVQREYEEREDLDSCWGHYGLEYCIQEAKEQVDYYVKEKEKGEEK